MDILMRYLTAAEIEKLKPYESYKVVHRRTGHVNYHFGSRHYKRRLGAANPDDKREARIYMVRKGGNPNPLLDDDPAERIKDMDLEGVDVNLMLPGSLGAFTVTEDVDLETAVYRAYHRWMADYCATFPHRLKGVILVGCRDLSTSLKELEHCAKEDWPLAVYVLAPTEFPLDHPDLERSGPRARIMIFRWPSIHFQSPRLTLRAVEIRGRTSFFSALRRTPGVASATWRRS
jgi:hypothetical protein